MAAKAGQKPQKMSTFAWEGKDKKGAAVSGESEAASMAAVKAELRRQGIIPKKVTKKSSLFGGRGGGGKIEPIDIAVLARQLATMMDSGVPLVQAFEIVGRGHEKMAMQKLVLAIKNDVEGGTALADALAKHPDYFDDLFCNLVEAGEQAGVLDTLLDKIATYKEKSESLKKKIKKALSYPIAVIVVAFIVTAILLVFVVPQFQELFAGFGADLPAFTMFVIHLSEFMQARWWLVLGGIVGAVYFFGYMKKKSPAFRERLDRISLKIKVIGPILEKAAFARFGRTMATMFAAGVPLVDAMESVAGATGNSVFEKGILKMKDEVAGGTQLQQSMQHSKLFPNMMVQMVAIGEESGALDTMLSKVADMYEEEVDAAVDSLTSLLEPLIMAFLGIVVGGLVVAMYLPIFKMGQVV